MTQKLQEWFWEPRGHDLESSDESLTVEDILTILHDWESESAVCGHAPNHSVCSRFRKSLYVLIKKAIYDGKSTRKENLNPLLEIARNRFAQTTWATFNWDCIFESSYWYSKPYLGPGSRGNPSLVIPIEGWRPGNPDHTLLKLHGGINWWRKGDKLTYLPWTGGGELTTKWSEYEQRDIEDGPVILEPSAYKYGDPNYELLKHQWDVFFDRLCAADFVIVIGYSLPESDSQARSRITIAAQVNRNCRWLVVDPSPEVCNRYKRLLGRRCLRTQLTTLSGFNNDITDNLQQAFPGVEFEDPAA